jgi:ribosomal protein L7Ae-like RNA K-turn-binding protein
MMADRIYSFMGLAAKAGKLLSGDETCERALKTGKVYLVIVSEDASDNTKKKFKDMCSYRNINYRLFGEKELIGKFTGKSVRSVIAIKDTNFAGHLVKMIDDRGIEHGGV